MIALPIIAVIVIVCVVVWLVVFIRVADVPTPKSSKIEPERPWPAPPTRVKP